MPINKEEILSMIEYNVLYNPIMHASVNYTSNFSDKRRYGKIELDYLLSIAYFAHSCNSKVNIVFMDRLALLDNVNFFSTFIDINTISQILSNDEDNIVLHGIPIFFLDGLSVHSFNKEYYNLIDQIDPKYRNNTTIVNLSIIKLMNNKSYLSIY